MYESFFDWKKVGLPQIRYLPNFKALRSFVCELWIFRHAEWHRIVKFDTYSKVRIGAWQNWCALAGSWGNHGCFLSVGGQGTSYLCAACQKWVHVRYSGLARSSLYRHCPVCCADQASPPLSRPQHHPPPTLIAPDSSPHQTQNRCNFRQINTSGILNSNHQLLQLLRDQNILIVCIQRTKFTETSTLPPFPSYAFFARTDHSGVQVGW